MNRYIATRARAIIDGRTCLWDARVPLHARLRDAQAIPWALSLVQKKGVERRVTSGMTPYNQSYTTRMTATRVRVQPGCLKGKIAHILGKAWIRFTQVRVSNPQVDSKPLA
jgi:hypothetical protein